MRENDTCLIWGTPANQIIDNRREGLYVTSPRSGGEYFVDKMAAYIVSKLNDREKARLTTWLIEQRRLGVEQPKLPTRDEIESIMQSPGMTVHSRGDRLLRYIQKKTPFIGFRYEFSPERESSDDDTLEMLAFTESVKKAELRYLCDYLVRRGWLTSDRMSFNVIITVGGYSRLAELEQAVTDSSQAFVAMWFDESVLDTWTQGFKPAIENAGYNPVRIDNQEYIGRIDDEIIAEIRRSRFVVADFTHGDGGARGGVYYEAGFAHGLDLPVIFTCRKDTIKHVHLDTRQYNHIVWDKPEELRERLTNRISAVIGDGPLKEEIRRN